jgi:hypothetical protein
LIWIVEIAKSVPANCIERYARAKRCCSGDSDSIASACVSVRVRVCEDYRGK